MVCAIFHSLSLGGLLSSYVHKNTLGIDSKRSNIVVLITGRLDECK